MDEARDDNALRARHRLPADGARRCPRRRTASGPGWSTACCATCWSTSPATRTAPSSASTSSIRPTGRAGRLGLVEFRAFEMPPHARMSLCQMLLLRALVARFWREPYRGAAGALGHASCTTASCCRTSSPRTSATWRATCSAPGYALRGALVRPVRRVPLPALRHASSTTASSSSCGRRSSRGTCWARRSAATGTARYVDSSVERLQVRVRGLTGERHVVTCNGRARAADADRRARRVRGRRALPRLGAAVGAASDDRRARAAGLRPGRHVERPLDRRLHVPRVASGRAQLRRPSR